MKTQHKNGFGVGIFLAAIALGAFDDADAYYYDKEYNFLRHSGGKKPKIRHFYLSFPQGKASRYYDKDCVEIYARRAVQATAIFVKKVKSEDDFILLYIKQNSNNKKGKQYGKEKTNNTRNRTNNY